MSSNKKDCQINWQSFSFDGVFMLTTDSWISLFVIIQYLMTALGEKLIALE